MIAIKELDELREELTQLAIVNSALRKLLDIEMSRNEDLEMCLKGEALYSKVTHDEDVILP
tara:strand:- start:160 stop:342 length:183 start_codon:yes stop_codon:yes gene_type:complete